MMMKAIVEALLSQEDKMKEAMSAYIDNIFVNNNVVSVMYIKEHLLWFKLNSRDLECLKEKMKVLGLEVWE